MPAFEALLLSKCHSPEGVVAWAEFVCYNEAANQMSHSDTFDKPFPLNDPVEPGRRKRPEGTQEISQGQRPWKLVQIKSCVPQGTPESAPKPTNSTNQGDE